MMLTEEAGRCPVCSSRNLMACYGLAFGGIGPYEVCEDCDEVVCKHVTLPGLCFNALDPDPSGAKTQNPKPNDPPRG